MCRVGVSIFNCGQLPLNSLRLASSLGGSLLLDKAVSLEQLYFIEATAIYIIIAWFRIIMLLELM